MKRFLSRIASFLFASAILLSHQTAMAWHTMGFDVSYRCLGGLDYEFTLYYYADCDAFQSAPATPSLCLESLSCTQFMSSKFDSIGPIPVPTMCNLKTTCAGGTIPGVQAFVYKDTISLPMACNDWTFVVQVCCRNLDINTGTSTATDMSIKIFLDNLNATCNSSPSFNELPFHVVCKSIPQVYDLSVTEPDGDSIVYRLDSAITTAVCQNPQLELIYNSPLSAFNPITTSGPFTFNTSTGEMSFTPDSVGEVTAVCIIVEEYRNSMLIGRIMRWIQFYVIDCTNMGPIADFIKDHSGLTISFSDNSDRATNWQWDFGDGNIDSVQNPIHSYSTAGSYTVCLITSNECGIDDTICKNIFVCATKAVFSASDTIICEGDSITFTNSSTGAASYVWKENGNTFSTSTSPSKAFNSSGTYVIDLVAVNSCNDTTSIIIQVLNPATVNFSADTVCIGDSTSFSDLSIAGDAPLTTWIWDFGDGNSSLQNPIHLFSQDSVQNVELTVTDQNGCSNDTILPVFVFALPDVNFGIDYNGLAVSFLDSSKNAAQWFWKFGDLNTSTLQNTANMYAAYGTYTACLTVTSADGCIDSLCKTVEVVNSIPEQNQVGMVKIYPNPFSDFSNIQIEDFANYKKGNPVFIVYDLFGTMYKEVNLSSENTIFIKGELASGLYFFEVVYDKKVIQRGKLICQ